MKNGRVASTFESTSDLNMGNGETETAGTGEESYSSYSAHHGWGENHKYSFDSPEADNALETHMAYEVFQFPGDVLVIPSNWGHATLNLCETISIAQEFGCLDDHVFSRTLILPIMQRNPPCYSRKSGIVFKNSLKQ